MNTQTQTQFKIDTNIPVPERVQTGKPEKYPFSQLEPRQSFFVPIEATEKDKAKHNLGHAAYVASKKAKERQGVEKKFAVRAVEEHDKLGIRVWRIQ